MVKKILRAFTGEIKNVHEAAYLLGFFALLAQILAMFRDRMLAHYFGAGATLDVYYAAFRIPDFIFTTVASLVAGSVLIPFFQKAFLEGEEKSKRIIDEVWSSFFLLVSFTCIVAFAAMPFLIRSLYPAMSLDSQALATTLSRIFLLSPIFLGFSNFLSSIIQAHRRFALYALSPVLYNVGIIAGIILLSPVLGIEGVAMGVVLGSVFHAAVQIPFARSIRSFPKFTFPVAWARLKEVAILSFPRTLALAGMNIVIVVLVALAAKMATGSISVFSFAYNLESGPLSIIGVSYSMAAFPTLARLFAGNEREKFVRYIASTLRHIIFLSLPAMALFIVVRAQIVRTVLGSGAFSWNDTRLTAACLALFSISIIAQNANLLFFRAYYAAGKTKTPLVISAFCSVFTVVISYVFYKSFYLFPSVAHWLAVILKIDDISGIEVISLPLGFTIGNLLNLALFIWIFDREFKHLFSAIRKTLAESAFASIVCGVAAYFALNLIGTVIKTDTLASVFSQGLIAGICGIVAWFATARLLKSKEADELLRNIKARIWKEAVPPIAPEQIEI